MSCITKLSKTIKQTIMQNKLLKITIYLIGFIVIFILMLMISSFAINWLVNTPNPFGLGFIDESNKDTWINFFGTIIGGITTLAGVWLTIREERKNSLEQQKRLELQRREDLAIQYKPYLNLYRQSDDYENMYYRDLEFMISCQSNSSNPEPAYILLNQKYKDTVKFVYSLKNFGRGNVYNASIEEYTIKNPEYFDMHLRSSKYLGHIGEIIPEQQIALVLYFPPLLRLKNEYLSQNEISTTLNCIIKYTDEFEVNTYELNIYFTLKIEIHKTDFPSEIDGVSIIAPTYYISGCMPSLKIINEDDN